MHKNISKSIFKKSRHKLVLISFCFLSILLFNIIPFNHFSKVNNINNDDKRNLENVNYGIESSDGGSILFEGIESPLNITDNGNLYEVNEEVTVSNTSETSLSYYLDKEHNWNVSRIEISIQDIQDTREWVNNSGFINNATVYCENVNLHNIPDSLPDHNYSNYLSYTDFDNSINHPGALAIRVHFYNMSFQPYYDCIFLWNKFGEMSYIDTGTKEDFFSPWILGDEITITIGSSSTINLYGYYIDRYEFVNASSGFLDNLDSWGNFTNGLNDNYGSGWIGNNTAMFTSLYSSPSRGGSYTQPYVAWYTDGEYSEIYQNVTVPRGKVVDAEISFAYYAEHATGSNENYIYMEINNKKIYSIGLRDVVEAGRCQWHYTGKINIDLWVNSSKIFNNPINNQKLNVSVGIMSGASLGYQNFEESYQQIIWFDNVSLSLITIANSTQEGIDLTVKTLSNEELITDGNEWGTGTLSLEEIWDSNPIILSFNTTSPNLSFILNTSLYGHHKTFSKINQLNVEGINYKILKNGTIYWEFYHNFYMPSQYTDFEFEIFKPKEWKLLKALDPTLQPRSFEGGEIDDKFIKINITNAIFPGWWHFKATSPNYINSSYTRLFKQGIWITNANFTTGEYTQISTQLNYSGMIPKDVGEINLTVYHPNGTIFFTESKPPEDGNVTFSQISFNSFNTVGGIYKYTLFWSNGTALGGLQSNFVVSHQSSLSLLKPNDAISDLTTEAFVEDIIPLRVHFKDYENNKDISGALITYNWTSGLEYFSDEGLGIYEANLDTTDLGTNGFYEIFINASKLGFKKHNITLQINLLEKTDLLRLDSAYYVELHDNSTIKYVYKDSLGVGISGASVDINIDNEYYSITDHHEGNYTIEFDTHYINDLGIYQIEINFSKPSFESQYAIFQFEVIQQSVDIIIYVNSQIIQENSLIEAMFKEKVNISVRVFAEIDEIYLTGGNITWNSDNFNKEIIEGGNSWFNDTIPLSETNFSTGLNSIYIRFEQNNYKIKNFGFQILISEQTVNISTFINGQKIERNTILELTFKEQIDISARVYANSEKVFLSGANITFISDNFNKNLEEKVFPWYNTSVDISNSYFSAGINYVYLKFELENYTSDIFSFQFLIKAQKLNLTVLVDSIEISENHLLEFNFNDEFLISAKTYALAEKIYLFNGIMTFSVKNYEKNFTSYETHWYTTSISCSPNIFSLGVNYVYLKFQKENYSTTFFSFQILVDQIGLNIDPINFKDSINTEMGETINISINLLDPNTNISIEKAYIRYSWDYGLGELNETIPGIYQTLIDLPENLKGTYRFSLIITPDDSVYKTTQYSFLVVISEPVIEEPSFPNYLLWIIIGVLISIVSVLAVLSVRTYVYLPKKRKREVKLIANTQRFKDLNNIQAIVIIHRFSGIPIYSKSYSILEKHKKELFSGFIQAITMIGEEFSEKEEVKTDSEEREKAYGVEKMMELDFKQFFCLIADIEDLRVVFILKERSSDRLKSQVSHLILALNLKLSNQLENWDGSLDQFEIMIPEILNEYFELYYKDSFKLNNDINLITVKKEKRVSKMEMRVINVIQSMSSDNTIANLNNIVDLVHEENKNLIIEAIESLIKQKIIIPLNN